MAVTLKEPLDPHDVTDFRFQGLRKVRLSGHLALTTSTMNLVTTVPNSGMLLVVGENCVHVVKTVDVEKQDKCSKAERNTENSQLSKVTIDLPGEVLSVGVSCDSLTTSIVVKVGQFPTCFLYDTRGIVNSPTDLPLSSTSFNSTSDRVVMTGLHWNPALPDMFCVTWSDGSLALYTVKADGSTDCLTLPPAAGVVAMAWSPKGKQLVVVKKNRDLVQYKPDLTVAKYPTLKEMKTIPGPAQDSLVPVSIAWLSTYEFLVGLREGGDQDARPGLWVVKGSKEGHVEHTPFDDICYSTGEGMGMVFTSHTLQEWGMVVVGSSASIELGVLGTEQGTGYRQWILEDNGRAEVPLARDSEESYPVGLAVDYTAAGETTPSPLLYLLSSDGLLCPFYCVNTRQGVQAIGRQREDLKDGKRTGTVPLPPPDKKDITLTTPTEPPTPAANIPNIFTLSGNSSFAQSTPLKPLPSSTSLFQPPPAAKDPTPPLPDLATISKEPSPPFSAFSKKLTPPTQPAKDPSPPLAKVPVGLASPFGKTVKDPTPPFSKVLSKDPTPILSKGSTPISKDPSPSLDLKPVLKHTTPLSNTTSAKVYAAIDEEYEAFEAELKELKTSLSGMKTFIGTQQDKIELCTRTEACSKFCKDVIDTTQCQNTEIFSLKSSTLETFSWLEEAKVRDTSTGDSRYLQLLRARPLDPRSLRKMEDLRGQFFYCEQQVEEAGNALDSQWEEHVGKLKRTVRSDQQSVREELSQAVMTNHKILERQSETVGEINKKLAHLQAAYPITMGRPGRSPGKGQGESELDKLAESLREKSKLTPAKTAVSQSSAIVSTPSPAKMSASAMVSPVKIFSTSTDKALRAMLDNRPLSITKAVRREIPAFKAADMPSSSKLLEKLKDPPPPSKPKIVASGSLSFPSGSLSEKSAFQALPATSKPSLSAFQAFPATSKHSLSAFQPVSLPKFTSGSISVEVSSSKPIKAPVYEPISPASDSPEKKEEVKEPNKIAFVLPSTPSLGSSLVKAMAPSNDQKAPLAAPAVSGKASVFPASAEPGPAKSLFANLGSASAPTSSGSSASLSSLSVSSSSFSASPATSLGGSAASSAGSSTDGASSSTLSSISSLGSKGDAVPGEAAATVTASGGRGLLATALTVSSSASIFGSGPGTALSSGFGGSVCGSTTATVTSVSSPKVSKSKNLGLPEISSAGGKALPAGDVSSSTTQSQSGSSGSIFGGSSLPVASTVSVFGSSSQTASSGSVFGASSVFGGSAQAAPSFGGTTEAATVDTGSVFPSSVSGGVALPVSSVASIFSVGAKSTSSSSVFGGTSVATSGSIFGGTPQLTATTGSVFGGPTLKKTATTASVFGGPSQSTSTAESVFGGTSQTSSAGSVFGGTSLPSSSTGSVFGVSTQPAASSGSVFGGSTQPTASSGSVFGGTSQPSVSSGTVFGGSSQPSSGTLFGGTSQSIVSTESVFSKPPQAVASSGSVFGGASQPVASTGSVFGGSSLPAASTGSVFGGASQPSATTGSVFGGTTNPVSTSSSVFGGPSQPKSSSASVFGGSGASTGSVFGGGSTAGSGGFLGGLGGTASADNSGKNPFGGASSTFGTSSSGGLFGSSGGQSVFGGSSQPSSFGSASAFSAGGNITSQGFGVQQSTPAKPAAGFGSAAAFGSPPALGSTAGFGSPAGFGASPAFGGASAFGGGATFGSAAAAASPAFGAAANAPTFGSMAGSSAPAFGSMTTSASAFGSVASSAPAFGSSGGGAFGGGAPTSPPPAGQQFNSWR